MSRVGFFINGNYISDLNLTALKSEGTVTAIARNESINGNTRYENFTVRRLTKTFGPEQGSIQHEIHQTGIIDGYDSRVSVSDGIIEAKFTNPYASWQGGWSSGFLIRNSGFNEFHGLIVNQSGQWFHRLSTGDTGTRRELKQRYSSLIRTIDSGTNHIRVIALGDEGWFFINDSYIDKLVLSGWTKSGRVFAIGTYFLDDGIAGYSTRFEDFTIWSAD